MAYPPTPTLAAAAVPVPKAFTGNHDPATGGTLTSPSWTTGNTMDEDGLNERATRSDLIARYGGGCWGVIPKEDGLGLNLSTTSGLTLNIAAGTAMMDGPVRYAGGSVTLTDNISRVYIYLSQAGAIVQVNASLTPPAGAHVFLGSCVTNSPSGSITGIDFSGVMYFNGGLAHRFTTDATVPGDAASLPNNLCFRHYGASDVWFFNGDQYWHESSGSSGTLAIADGGTGATTAQGARTSLGLQQQGHLDVDVAGATNLVAADIMAVSSIRLVDDGVSSHTTVSFPSMGLTDGSIWTIKNATGEGITLNRSGGSNALFMQDAHTKTVVVFASDVWEVGRGLPNYLSSADQVISDPTTLSSWAQVEADYVEWLPQDNPTLLSYPASLDVKGRIQVIQNGSTTDGLNVSTDGISASDDAAATYLLPGAFYPFVVELNGNFTPLITRARTRSRVEQFPSDGNHTASQAAWLASTIEATSAGALTATRDLILPLLADTEWFIANLTTGGQSIRAIGASGTGITIANGACARVRCNGTNFRRLTGDATY